MSNKELFARARRLVRHTQELSALQSQIAALESAESDAYASCARAVADIRELHPGWPLCVLDVGDGMAVVITNSDVSVEALVKEDPA